MSIKCTVGRQLNPKMNTRKTLLAPCQSATRQELPLCYKILLSSNGLTKYKNFKNLKLHIFCIIEFLPRNSLFPFPNSLLLGRMYHHS